MEIPKSEQLLELGQGLASLLTWLIEDYYFVKDLEGLPSGLGFRKRIQTWSPTELVIKLTNLGVASQTIADLKLNLADLEKLVTLENVDISDHLKGYGQKYYVQTLTDIMQVVTYAPDYASGLAHDIAAYYLQSQRAAAEYIPLQNELALQTLNSFFPQLAVVLSEELNIKVLASKVERDRALYAAMFSGLDGGLDELVNVIVDVCDFLDAEVKPDFADEYFKAYDATKLVDYLQLLVTVSKENGVLASEFKAKLLSKLMDKHGNRYSQITLNDTIDAFVNLATADYSQPQSLVFKITLTYLNFRLTNSSLDEVKAEAEIIYKVFPYLAFTPQFRFLVAPAAALTPEATVVVVPARPSPAESTYYINGEQAELDDVLKVISLQVAEIVISRKTSKIKADIRSAMQLIIYEREFDHNIVAAELRKAGARCQIIEYDEDVITLRYRVGEQVALIWIHQDSRGNLDITVSSDAES